MPSTIWLGLWITLGLGLTHTNQTRTRENMELEQNCRKAGIGSTRWQILTNEVSIP